MSRQLNLTKIENRNRRLVTFSKRKSSIIRKARDMSISCGIDVAVIAFSPAGRPNVFSGQNRVEDLLQRYISLPPQRRNGHITNVQDKVNRFAELAHIDADEIKLYTLDTHIKNLEHQIRNSEAELEEMEAYLRAYEPDPKRDPTPAELLVCEENLRRSLNFVTERKKLLCGSISTRRTPNGFQIEVEQFFPFPNNGSFSLNNLFGSQNQIINPNLIIGPNSFYGPMVEYPSSEIVHNQISGYSVSPFQIQIPYAPVRIPRIFSTLELSYYYSFNHGQPNHVTQQTYYQDLNSIVPLHYEQSSSFIEAWTDFSRDLSAWAFDPFFEKFRNSIMFMVEDALISTELSNLLTLPMEDGAMDFDLPELLSTEAMLLEMEAAGNGQFGRWDLDGYALPRI